MAYINSDNNHIVDPNIENNKFKTASGAYLTQSLFIDFAAYIGTEDSAMFTVRDRDYTRKGITYPSMKKIFLADNDITGYNFAIENLDGWKHYTILRNSKRLAPYFDEWEAEKEVKLMSLGMQGIINQINQGNYIASKWAADKGWSSRRGRPSLAEKKKKLSQQGKVIEQLSDGMILLNKDKNNG